MFVYEEQYMRIKVGMQYRENVDMLTVYVNMQKTYLFGDNGSTENVYVIERRFLMCWKRLKV